MIQMIIQIHLIHMRITRFVKSSTVEAKGRTLDIAVHLVTPDEITWNILDYSSVPLYISTNIFPLLLDVDILKF